MTYVILENAVKRQAGTECPTEREIIWDKNLCERAILATFGISGNNLNKWVAPGSNYGIPGGCSYRESDKTMHFNGRVGIDGKGRSDLIPVCLGDSAASNTKFSIYLEYILTLSNICS